MATYLKKGDPLVCCPYDPVHKVKQSRLQLHIAKCQAQQPEKDIKDVCPFNAQHRIDKGQLQYHLSNCPDRAPLDRMLTQKPDKNNTFRGCLAVPSYNQIVTTNSESWETDMYFQPTAGYKPRSAPPKNGLIGDLGMTKPAERKKIYKELHSKGSGSENPDDDSGETTKLSEKLRQPKQTSEELLLQEKYSGLDNLGLGRGQPVASTRIAANIFRPQDKGEMRQPRSFSDILTGVGNLNLGMGRGRGLPVVPKVTSPDFPPLGKSDIETKLSNDSPT